MKPGDRFGHWVTLSLVRRDAKHAWWLCVCDCGVQKEVYQYALRKGSSQSCGCFGREQTILKKTTHGMAGTQKFRLWASIKGRCYNRKNPAYKHYGGRGIIMCERWKNSVEAFWNDMGPCPPGASIDRVDNNGPYSPENCRWATLREQSLNKRNTLKVTLNGRVVPLLDACSETGLGYRTLMARVSAGWSEDRLFIPVSDTYRAGQAQAKATRRQKHMKMLTAADQGV